MIIKTRQLTSKFAPLILAVLVVGSEARGDITITIEQVGNNVVETGSGAVTAAGLTAIDTEGFLPQLLPQVAIAIVGSADQTLAVYTGLTGPANFGSGTGKAFDTGTGSTFGIFGAAPGGELALPIGYVADTPLSGSATFYNTDFTKLGLTAGTYTYTWGPGSDQSLTVQIVPTATAVPEPSTAIVAVFGAIAFVTYGWTLHRRQHRRQVSA